MHFERFWPLLIALFFVPQLSLGIDFAFIQGALGRTIPYETELSGDLSVPNCVATALRAGGYLPTMSVSGVDDVYREIFPSCFRRREGAPRAGDIGVLFHGGDVAHMVLFVSETEVFEKLSPAEYDHFRMNTWSIKNWPGVSEGKVFAFKGWRGCVLNSVWRDFKKDALLQRAKKEIEERLFTSDWSSPLRYVTREEIQARVEKYNSNDFSLRMLWAFPTHRGRTRFNNRRDPLVLLKGTPAFGGIRNH